MVMIRCLIIGLLSFSEAIASSFSVVADLKTELGQSMHLKTDSGTLEQIYSDIDFPLLNASKCRLCDLHSINRNEEFDYEKTILKAQGQTLTLKAASFRFKDIGFLFAQSRKPKVSISFAGCDHLRITLHPVDAEFPIWIIKGSLSVISNDYIGGVWKRGDIPYLCIEDFQAVNLRIILEQKPFRRSADGFLVNHGISPASSSAP